MKIRKSFIATVQAMAVIVAIILVSIVATSCGKAKTTTTQGDTQAVDSGTTTKGESTTTPVNRENMLRSKLTGEWVDKATVNNKPVAVMLENSSDAVPQSSIGSADIVFESIAEGGITRLCAVFENCTSLDKIGPVRSCRMYYLAFAKEFESTYVHYGYAASAEQYLAQEKFHSLDGMVYCGFYRSTDRVAPHNAYTSWQGIMDSVAAKGYPTEYPDGYEQPIKFTENDNQQVTLEGDGVQTCKKLYPGYANNKPWFTYDESTGEYLRFQFGEKMIDAETGNQLSYKNVIIKYAFIEGWFGQTPNFTLYGEGYGLYVTNGKAEVIKWKKSEFMTGQTHYYYSDGTEVQFNQGKTWICQVEANQEVQVLDSAN